MQVNIPDTVIQEMVDANIIQTYGNVQSAESRGQQVQRLTYHIGEYVVALIGKEMRNRKLLPYAKHD